MNITILGIAGGTGSGKTYAVKNLLNEYPQNSVLSISMDSYYKDLSHINYEKRIEQNFDHPDSIDINLLKKHLEQASKGDKINIPIYDFINHVRLGETISISNAEIIIVEGIFALHFSQLRKLYTLKLFMDTPENIRLERRLVRDVRERGRTIKSIKDQYNSTVLPMHNKYVEPSKVFSDLILDGRDNINDITYKIEELIKS